MESHFPIITMILAYYAKIHMINIMHNIQFIQILLWSYTRVLHCISYCNVYMLPGYAGLYMLVNIEKYNNNPNLFQPSTNSKFKLFSVKKYICNITYLILIQAHMPTKHNNPQKWQNSIPFLYVFSTNYKIKYQFGYFNF